MFDIDLPGGESYRESNAYRPGDAAVLAETPWGRLGMTICYDVRFPYLYRALAQAGADFLVGAVGVHGADRPGALACADAGAGHRKRLLRLRPGAVAASTPSGRKTYGHSLIVDPWGEVLAEGGEGMGVVTARIDPARIAKARAHGAVIAARPRFHAAGVCPSEAGRRVASSSVSS